MKPVADEKNLLPVDDALDKDFVLVLPELEKTMLKHFVDETLKTELV